MSLKTQTGFLIQNERKIIYFVLVRVRFIFGWWTKKNKNKNNKKINNSMSKRQFETKPKFVSVAQSNRIKELKLRRKMRVCKIFQFVRHFVFVNRIFSVGFMKLISDLSNFFFLGEFSFQLKQRTWSTKRASSEASDKQSKRSLFIWT